MTKEDLIEDKEYFIKCDYRFVEKAKEKEAIDNLYYCLDHFPERYRDCDCDQNIKKLIWIKDGLSIFTGLYKQALKQNNTSLLQEIQKEIKSYQHLLTE